MPSPNSTAELAKVLARRGEVAFSFFDACALGERLVVSVRVANEWDRIDTEAEGNQECVPGEDFVVGLPRRGAEVFDTSLQFENTAAASQAVIRELLKDASPEA